MLVLIKHLPRDSALQRELHGEVAEWSITDHLLAATVDHLAAANWMFQCVNASEDGDQPDPPKPVPRPGDRDEETEERGGDSPEAETPEVSPGQLARFFG
ncbi:MULTISPECIES: DUF5361 domain-containing protein [unclassified Streptomyces]|uniref:DUF5361 domain-containing protein n=1 Tax=Streptomyces sp. SID5770 TaxID=2690308 RepID=UPI001F08AF79|nr:DUF5361 domain-containing protein [Streptomyces sp. S1]